MSVWISEDGTRITGRLQYDPGSNQIVGLLLPLDENGLPKEKILWRQVPVQWKNMLTTTRSRLQ